MTRHFVNAKVHVVEEEGARAKTEEDVKKPDPTPAEGQKAIDDKTVLTAEGLGGVASENTRGANRRRSS